MNSFNSASKLYADKRYDEAFSRYLDLAEQGYANCMSFVGWMLYKGIGTDRNLEESVKWLQLATEKGDIEACFYLGKIYSEKNSMSEAIKLYEKAAANGFFPAYYLLGEIYMIGKGVDINRKKALEYFGKAAEHGHIYARKQVAISMIKGEQGASKIMRGLLSLVSLLRDTFQIGKETNDHDLRVRY